MLVGSDSNRLDRTPGKPRALCSKNTLELGEFLCEIGLFDSTGKLDFGFIERKGVSFGILSVNDVVSMVVAVGLASVTGSVFVDFRFAPADVLLLTDG